MDLALYDPEAGYYARAPRRSGRAGDFFTSVDVGPLFGRLLEAQVAEMAGLLHPEEPAASGPFDLVEAGAGDGRLSADLLDAARTHNPSLYARTRLHLVEASAAARASHRRTLGASADRLAYSGAALPAGFEGVLVANELLDAFPVHQVVMRGGALREVYVDADFRIGEGAPSTPALGAYLRRLGIVLDEGWRAEINLSAVEWILQAAQRLARGFLVLIDYGHEARRLYSAAHAAGTLTSFTRHTAALGDPSATSRDRPAWAHRPGEQDITAHVDFTSVRAAAESAGLTTIALLDQTYFLLGIVRALDAEGDRGALVPSPRALKTLIMPGGLGSTMKVLVMGKGVGRPALRGVSFAARMT
ncbi:MAG: SAM-dependent methyltransferase [Acidobacteria bacterium]|nr:SAM-dependent methyltransferase [Acidobacteriota bacterium]